VPRQTRTEVIDRRYDRSRHKIRSAQLRRKRARRRPAYQGVQARCVRCRVQTRFYRTEDAAIQALGRTWGYVLCTDPINGLLHAKRTWAWA